MGLKKSVANFFDDLKFFLSIYTWLETWILIAYGLTVTGAWLLIAYALALPNPIRSVIIWTVILALAILVPKALASIPKK